MKIDYRPHLRIRLKQRKVPFSFPKQIIDSPEQEYFDALARRNIAIKKLFFEGKLRNIVVAYDIIKNKIEIVTIHIISEKEIKNKVQIGRWRKNEKN